MNTRKYATADQLAAYTVPTTAFSLVGSADCTACTPRMPRRKVADSLARSLAEHADAWEELAKR